ncbi:solute carrier family 35 member G1-like isoform X1 [Apostichopus japonicus]
MDAGNNIPNKGKSELTQENPPNSCTIIMEHMLTQVRENRAIIYSLMSAICYAGVSITAYESSLYLTATEIPMWVALSVFCLTVVCILIKRPVFPSTIAEVMLIISSGIFCGGGGVCLLLAVVFVGPGDAIAIYYTMPVICTILGITCFGEPMNVKKIILLCLAVVGASFISGPTFLFGIPLSYNSMYAIGLVLALLASIGYGTSFTLIHYTSAKYETDPFIFSLATAASASCFSTITYLVFQEPSFPSEIYGLLVLASCSCFSFLAGLSLAFALSVESASFVAIVSTTEMLFTYLAQFIVFDLKPTWLSASGAVMVFVSCVGLNFLKTDNGDAGIEDDDSKKPLIEDHKEESK